MIFPRKIRQNRLVKTTDPLGKFETFSYDANGNLVETIDRRLSTIDFQYDAVNQLIQKTAPGPLTTTFSYDTVGNLTTVNDPDSALSFTYDGASRLLSSATTGSPNQPNVTISYTYDKNSNRLTMLALSGVEGTDGIGGTTNYTYDALNRLSILDPPSSSPVNFTYDALGRRASTTLPNGVVTNYSYDAASQLSAISHQLSAGPKVAAARCSRPSVWRCLRLSERPERRLRPAKQNVVPKAGLILWVSSIK